MSAYLTGRNGSHLPFDCVCHIPSPKPHTTAMANTYLSWPGSGTQIYSKTNIAMLIQAASPNRTYRPVYLAIRDVTRALTVVAQP